MSRVLAAVAPDSAAAPVLATAAAVAKMLHADVWALHVGTEQDLLSTLADRAEVELETTPGETLPTLAQAASGHDVVAVVVGARSENDGKRPAGSTALALITLQRRPVIVVPPDAPVRTEIESILVPLDGTPASAAALGEIIRLAHDSALRIVVAHVHGEHTLPAFSDHLPHEVRAWNEEFIARHCPTAPEATLELRVGEAHEHVLDILRQSGCDLVALGWQQHLEPGRAAVVQRLLSESPVPVLLTPVTRSGAAAQTGAPRSSIGKRSAKPGPARSRPTGRQSPHR